MPFTDYYDQIPGLDRHKDRKENYNILVKANVTWGRRRTAKMQSLITEAMAVFGDESEYEEFRKKLAEKELIPLIKGAAMDGVVTEREKAGLIERGRRLRFSEKEVVAFIRGSGGKIVSGGRSKRRNTRVWELLAGGIAGFVLLAWLASLPSIKTQRPPQVVREAPPVLTFGDYLAKAEFYLTRVTHPFCNYLIINGLQ